MNYIKAQREIFNAIARNERAIGFNMEGERICVTTTGYYAFIFPVEMISFNPNKLAKMDALAVHELIAPENELTLTQIFRAENNGIGRCNMHRLLRGPGKNVYVNSKYLECFDNPKFYQAKENKFSHIVVTEYSDYLDKDIPVAIVLPIKYYFDDDYIKEAEPCG